MLKDKPVLAGFLGAAMFGGALFLAFVIYANIKKTGTPAYVPPANATLNEEEEKK